MGERFEWVQIIEPKSKDTMYANLVTGECVWEAPLDAKIKCTDENQWWELFDTSTKRNYYYNAKTQRTVWQRPSSADIIPLAKLQMIKENTEAKEEQTIITQPPSILNHTVQQLTSTNNTSSIITNKWKQISLQGLNGTSEETKLKISTPSFHSTPAQQQRSLRRTATILNPHPMFSSSTSNDLTFSMKLNKIKTDISTYDNITNSIPYPLNKKTNQHFLNNAYDNYPIDFNHQRNPLEQQSLQAKRSQSIHLKTPFTYQIPSNETNHPPPRTNPSKDFFSSINQSSSNILRHISTPSLELFPNNHIRKKQPRTNPNYVNIQIKSSDGSFRSTYIRIDPTPSSSPSTSSSEQDSILFHSQSNEYFPSDETIHTDDDNNINKHSFNINFQPMKMINNGHNNPSTFSSSILPIYYDTHSNSPSLTSHSMNRSRDTDSIDSSSSLTRSTSIHFNGLSNNKKDVQQWNPSSIKSPMILNEIESEILLNEMLNLNIHKRGLFSKRLTQDNLLSWSKESLTKPLLRTIDKILKKEAPETFKLIQIYMGDRKSKQVASLNICLELTTKGWSLPSIRDEVYLQLIKQTSYNYHAESLQRGWELLAVCLSFFPPSSKFQILLERYIVFQTSGDNDIPEVPITIYAKVCQKRLEKILQTGPKKGLKKPTFEEIELSKHTIHFPSMFGATLEEVMAMQRTRYPERSLPWIQTILSQEVLRLHGAQTEGIFRVPGDLDSVNALKVKCDQWQFPLLEDAHLPASLLKLWYRELAEPLIPSMFYEQCILNCDVAEVCIRLVHSLPDINRTVLTYLIRFLQIFASPENVVVTKMDVNNLSMVFAPNILRCDSEDAKIIFENARKEMLFIKILILHLDTNSIESVI